MERIDFTGIFDYERGFMPFTGYTDLCGSIISMSEKSRREGLLALEDDIESTGNSLMRLLLQLVVDGTDPDLVSQIGENKTDCILHYLEEILSCTEFALFNRNSPDYDRVFGLYVKSRNTDRYAELVDKIKQQVDSFTQGQDLTGLSGRYCAVIETVLSDLDEDYRRLIIGNHIDSVLHINNTYSKIILAGMLGVQSGYNPRILQERLFSFTALAANNG